jgi:tRNA pseudouridine55 synthase
MDEILLVNKPAGWTSFDVVAKVRSNLNNKQQKTNSKQASKNQPSKKLRVGHAGTLDPFATGLLILLIGKATKEQEKFMKLDKEYEATLKLGYTSTTGDPEGTINKFPNSNFKAPNMVQISKVLKDFTGEISQTPPAFSAIKVNGQRAYKLARAGVTVKIKPRLIIIHKLILLDYKYPRLILRVECSSGTYVRTLAEDIGKALGSGAYLAALKRTKIGQYRIEDAEEIEKIKLT